MLNQRVDEILDKQIEQIFEFNETMRKVNQTVGNYATEEHWLRIILAGDASDGYGADTWHWTIRTCGLPVAVDNWFSPSGDPSDRPGYRSLHLIQHPSPSM